MMINNTISFLAAELNTYFRNSLAINENKVLVSAIVNPDGSLAIQGENKMIFTLINFEQSVPRTNPFVKVKNETSLLQMPPVNTTLHVLVSAYFSSANYPEALKFLSSTISFFIKKSVFDQQDVAELSPEITKLVVEMETKSSQELNDIWNMHGGKYFPSVIYRINIS